MTDEEFFAFLSACRNELAERQLCFQQSMSDGAPWSYDLADCSLTIATRRFPMTPIGSHSPEYQTWLWTWANESFAPLARETSRRIQELNAVTKFQVFLDPGIDASPSDAEDFTALAVHQLGAIGFFRSPSDDPTSYLAVHEPAAEGRLA
jgi:hypothetical protein